MKKFLIIAIGIFLVGCSDNGQTPSDIPTEKIRVGKHTWTLSLPESWEKIPVPRSGPDAVFLARKDSQNLAILRRFGTSEHLVDEILETARNGFSIFEEISRGENEWTFRAKTKATSPLRDFWQKIELIPNSDEFLLASCSVETTSNEPSGCKAILDSFKISVDRPKGKN